MTSYRSIISRHHGRERSSQSGLYYELDPVKRHNLVMRTRQAQGNKAAAIGN